jgi:PAS domain S-box-containing protein
LNTQNKAAIESAYLTLKQAEDLSLYRRLLLITLVLYPVFGYINTFVHVPAEETLGIFYQRLVFSLLIAISVGASYYSKRIQLRFYTIISFFVYLGFSHLSYIAFLRGYSMNHLVGVVMVYVGTSLVFRKNLHLNLYIVYATILSIIIAFIAPHGEVSRVMVILIIGCISMVLFVGINMKIKAEIRLKHNEANFSAITENTSDLIWSIDLKYKLLSANNAAIEHFKLQGMHSISVGKKIDLLIITSELKEEWENYYQRALAGEIFTITQQEDINAQVYEHSFYPIKNSKKIVKGTCVFSRNITQQIDRENKLKFAQRIAKTGSFSRNFSTGTYTWSDYMYELFQLPTSTDINSLVMKEFIHPEDYGSYESLFTSAFETGKSFSLQYRIVRKNFSIIPVIANVVLLLNDQKKVVEINGTIQDYTEQSRLQVLEKNNQSLQKEKEFSETLNRQYTSVLTNLQSEIRTPLTTLLGISNLFSSMEIIHPTQREYVTEIQNNSKKMLSIVNKVMDFTYFSKEAITLRNETYSVKELLSSVILANHNEASKKSISLRYFMEKEVTDLQVGDEAQLTKVLSHLVLSSIQMTDQGEVILAAAMETQGSDSTLLFKVIDTGKGYTEEEKKGLFEALELNETQTEFSPKKSGFALSISKQIIELMGGTMEVSSWVGLGSEFVIRIPLNAPTAIQVTKEAEKEEDALSILLVEDNPFNQMVAIETIEGWNPNVRIHLAENGAEAIALLRKITCNLILMDIQMPVMDGHEASKFIRTELEEPARSTPIVAVTAHAFTEEIARCYENGMNDYLSKPFDGDELIEKIQKHARKSIQVQELVREVTSPAIMINFQAIEDFTNGKKERIQKMVRMFLKDTPNELSRLKALISEGNYPAIQTLSHSFKPKYAYMGMAELSETAKKIEYLAKEEGALEEIKELFAYLEGQSKLAYVVLEQYATPMES